jgi:hypothetical protein
LVGENRPGNEHQSGRKTEQNVARLFQNIYRVLKHKEDNLTTSAAKQRLHLLRTSRLTLHVLSKLSEEDLLKVFSRHPKGHRVAYCQSTRHGTIIFLSHLTESQMGFEKCRTKEEALQLVVCYLQ